jgi:hypothetical protein
LPTQVGAQLFCVCVPEQREIARGFPASPLVVVDEPKRIGQSIQVGQKIAMVEIGPAVEDDDGLPRPISLA